MRWRAAFVAVVVLLLAYGAWYAHVRKRTVAWGLPEKVTSFFVGGQADLIKLWILMPAMKVDHLVTGRDTMINDFVSFQHYRLTTDLPPLLIDPNDRDRNHGHFCPG